jgi:DNA mismatch endonuclease (patch repair protein)
MLRKQLWQRGFRYRLHMRLPGRPDICFARVRLAVFVDGCFWHQCPIHYTAPVRNAQFWAEKIASNVRRDKDAQQALERLGWKVLRLWEHEIHSDLEAVIQRVTHEAISRGTAASNTGR